MMQREMVNTDICKQSCINTKSVDFFLLEKVGNLKTGTGFVAV